MTGKERMQRILRHEPVDRIGLYEHFWNDTYQAWQQQGHIAPGESYEDHFGFDMQEHWSFNLTADLDFERQVVEVLFPLIQSVKGIFGTHQTTGSSRRTGTLLWDGCRSAAPARASITFPSREITRKSFSRMSISGLTKRL